MGSGRVENQACCPYTAGSMRARLVPSRRLALAFVSLLGAILGVVLFSESARVPLRTPLVPRSARGEPTTIALEGREGARGSIRFRATLVATDPRALDDAEELQLFLEPDAAGRNRLRGAAGSRLGVRIHRKRAGRDRSRPAHRLPPLARLLASGGAAPGTALDLAVEAKGSGDLACWASSLCGCGPGADPSAVARGEEAAGRRAGRIRSATRRRPHESSFSTTCGAFSPGIAWIARLAGAAVGLALAGCLAFPTRPLGGESSSPAVAAVVRAGVGAALLAASLAALYAVLAPPLSGPDEPYHLLGYAELTRDGALAEDVVAWMAETHLWRIRYNPKSTFAPSTSGSRSSSSTLSCAPPRSLSAVRCSHGSSGPWRRS